MGLGEVVRLPLRASWRQRCIQCSWEMFMCRWGKEGLLSVVGVIRKGGAVRCSTRSGWGSRCRFCVLSVPPAQSRRSFLTGKRKQRGHPLILNTYLGFTDTNLRLFRQWSNFYCKKGVVSSFLPYAPSGQVDAGTGSLRELHAMGQSIVLSVFVEIASRLLEVKSDAGFPTLTPYVQNPFVVAEASVQP